MTLDEIAIKYGTDKSSKAHNYTRWYEKYLNNQTSILEIGIQNGYSLKMWKDYLPEAEIYGLDIVDCSHMAEDRIHILQGSQTNPELLKTLDYFDVIIDDGSHQSRDMQTTFDILFPLLKKGGLYVVEDLHCCYWDDFGYGNFMNRLKELCDILNAKGKSGYGDKKNDTEEVEYDWWEDNIEFIHFYRSIVFIKKI